MKTNRIITLTSIAITLTYLIALFVMYGLKSSISSYAKNLIENGHEWMLITWLTSLFVTTSFISVKDKKKYSTFLFMSGFVLLLIIFFTGYYPGFESHATEDIIHVASVYIAIPCAFIYMIADGVKKDNEFYPIMLTSFFVSFTLIAIMLNLPKHTYWIEVVALVNIYSYLYFKK